jgi:hypothetical protein
LPPAHLRNGRAGTSTADVFLAKFRGSKRVRVSLPVRNTWNERPRWQRCSTRSGDPRRVLPLVRRPGRPSTRGARAVQGSRSRTRPGPRAPRLAGWGTRRALPAVAASCLRRAFRLGFDLPIRPPSSTLTMPSALVILLPAARKAGGNNSTHHAPTPASFSRGGSPLATPWPRGRHDDRRVLRVRSGPG